MGGSPRKSSNTSGPLYPTAPIFEVFFGSFLMRQNTMCFRYWIDGELRQIIQENPDRAHAVHRANAGIKACKEHGFDFVVEIFHHYGGRVEVLAGTPKGLAHQKTLF